MYVNALRATDDVHAKKETQRTIISVIKGLIEFEKKKKKFDVVIVVCKDEYVVHINKNEEMILYGEDCRKQGHAQGHAQGQGA